MGRRLDWTLALELLPFLTILPPPLPPLQDVQAFPFPEIPPMSTSHCLRFALVLSWASHAFAQGALAPIAPPNPSMKALDQIASTGTEINATNTPGSAT